MMSLAIEKLSSLELLNLSWFAVIQVGFVRTFFKWLRRFSASRFTWKSEFLPCADDRSARIHYVTNY